MFSTAGTSVPGFGYLAVTTTEPFLGVHTFVNGLAKANTITKVLAGIGAYAGYDFANAKYTAFLYYQGYDQLNKFNLPLQFTYPFWSKFL